MSETLTSRNVDFRKLRPTEALSRHRRQPADRGPVARRAVFFDDSSRDANIRVLVVTNYTNCSVSIRVELLYSSVHLHERG